jgi:hypothetical protein
MHRSFPAEEWAKWEALASMGALQSFAFPSQRSPQSKGVDMRRNRLALMQQLSVWTPSRMRTARETFEVCKTSKVCHEDFTLESVRLISSEALAYSHRLCYNVAVRF